ncbi:MAG TPA: BadF/BadG/BcrA/BcrD ATPase family protein [Candidatus Kryptonia bacterium]
MTADKFYVGIDGGATKVKAVAIDSEKNVVAEVTGGAANFQIIGADAAVTNIHFVVESITKRLKSDFSNVAAICMGLAGAGRKDDSEKIRAHYVGLLRKKQLPVPKVFVESDAMAALEGAFGGKPGMILISGTGSILFAKEKDDVLHRVGGWGRFIGDEGSGYSLGRGALTAVVRELDGRGDKTMMTDLLRSRFKIDGAQTLITELYQNNLDVASVAPIVIEAAANGDAAAIEVIDWNVKELIQHVDAMLAKLKKVLPLALIGGVLSSDNSFSRTFRKQMADKFPDVRIQEPEFSPAVGAALIAYRLGGPLR